MLLKCSGQGTCKVSIKSACKEVFLRLQKEQQACKDMLNAIKEMLTSFPSLPHNLKIALHTSYILGTIFYLRISALQTLGFLKVIIAQLFLLNGATSRE
jgi:tetrahydromethanopterin S-methyltransferase subunit B